MELGEQSFRPARKTGQYFMLSRRLKEVAISLGVRQNTVPAGQSDVDRLHAYRVLAHAEVEGYVEGLAEAILRETERRALLGMLTHAGHHLIVHWSISKLKDQDGAARSTYPAFRSDDARVLVQSGSLEWRAAIASHRSKVDSNHGVKASNVRQLLLPLGYRENFFTPGLLDKLTNFGSERGSVAHGSGVVGAYLWTSGSVELGRVDALLPGLKRLEQFVPPLLAPA